MGIATVHYLSMNARDGHLELPTGTGPQGGILEDWSGSYSFYDLQVPNVYTVNWGDSTPTEDVVVGGAISRINTAGSHTTVSPFMFDDPNPYDIAILPDNKTAYVTQPQAGDFNGNTVGRISIVNLETKTVLDNIAIPNNYWVWGITSTSDGKKVYVASSANQGGDGGADDKVFVIDTKKKKVVKEITVGRYPTGVALNPDETELWVTCCVDDALYVINTATDEVDRHLDFPDSNTEPMRGVFSNAGDVFYVTLWGLGQVAAIPTDATDLSDFDFLNVNDPFGIGKNADGSRLAVASNSESEVVIIGTDPFDILDTVETHNYPWEVSVDADDVVYVTTGEGYVDFVNINVATSGGSKYVGYNASGITISPNGTYAYVTVFGWSDCDGYDDNFSLYHTYANPGTYTITATDKDGQVDVKGTVRVLVD